MPRKAAAVNQANAANAPNSDIVTSIAESIPTPLTAAAAVPAPVPAPAPAPPRRSSPRTSPPQVLVLNNAQRTTAIYCQNCDQLVIPDILLRRSPALNILALVLCLLCLWPCAICVFCCPCGLIAYFFCPTCGTLLKTEVLS